MLKPVIAATAVIAFAGSSLVYAQQRFGDRESGFGQRGARFEHRHPVNPADMAAFTDARIAALKAGLELTPDQARKNWPAFEQALRDMAQLRMAAHRGAGRRGCNRVGTQPSAAPQQGAARHSRVSRRNRPRLRTVRSIA